LKKVCFLQDRNPGVPGIIYKLDAESDGIRKLNNVRVLWKSTAVIGKISIRDIYSGSELDTNKFDLDHFVPWSYVTNDELWNLTPMDSQLNSSKSNSLPTWKRYFPEFANNQYHLYKMIFAYPEIRKLFEKCRRDNLNAIWASETLFISGNSEEQFKNVLEHNLRPIYDMAYLQGYSLWQFDEQSSALLVDDRSQENYKVNANH